MLTDAQREDRMQDKLALAIISLLAAGSWLAATWVAYLILVPFTA